MSFQILSNCFLISICSFLKTLYFTYFQSVPGNSTISISHSVSWIPLICYSIEHSCDLRRNKKFKISNNPIAFNVSLTEYKFIILYGRVSIQIRSDIMIKSCRWDYWGTNPKRDAKAWKILYWWLILTSGSENVILFVTDVHYFGMIVVFIQFEMSMFYVPM